MTGTVVGAHRKERSQDSGMRRTSHPLGPDPGSPCVSPHKIGPEMRRVIASFSFHMHVNNVSSGEGSGTPLQYSCLENPMDGGAW